MHYLPLGVHLGRLRVKAESKQSGVKTLWSREFEVSSLHSSNELILGYEAEQGKAIAVTFYRSHASAPWWIFSIYCTFLEDERVVFQARNGMQFVWDQGTQPPLLSPPLVPTTLHASLPPPYVETSFVSSSIGTSMASNGLATIGNTTNDVFSYDEGPTPAISSTGISYSGISSTRLNSSTSYEESNVLPSRTMPSSPSTSINTSSKPYSPSTASISTPIKPHSPSTSSLNPLNEPLSNPRSPTSPTSPISPSSPTSPHQIKNNNISLSQFQANMKEKSLLTYLQDSPTAQTLAKHLITSPNNQTIIEWFLKPPQSLFLAPLLHTPAGDVISVLVSRSRPPEVQDPCVSGRF